MMLETNFFYLWGFFNRCPAFCYFFFLSLGNQYNGFGSNVIKKHSGLKSMNLSIYD
jgi:hypothetical protein